MTGAGSPSSRRPPRDGRKRPSGVRLVVLAVLAALPDPVLARDGAGAGFAGLFLTARHAQQAGDWATASLAMDRLLSRTPDDQTLIQRQFILELEQGAVDTALPFARRLSLVDQDRHAATALIVADALRQGHPAEARAALTAEPVEGLARLTLPLIGSWVALAEKAAPDGAALPPALDRLSPLAAIPGIGPLYRLHAGMIAEATGDQAAAERFFGELPTRDTPLRLIDKAVLFEQRAGRDDKARALIEAWRNATGDSLMADGLAARLGATPPPLPTPTQGLAEALVDIASLINQEGAADFALLYDRIALWLQPDLPAARLLAGDILATRGHLAEALDQYQALSALPGATGLAWTADLRRAQILERTDAGAAETLLRRMAADQPQRTDALARLGDLMRDGKRYADAIAAYSEALKRIPAPQAQDWPLFYARGVAYDRLDRWPEAEADLLKAIDLAPGQALLLNYLGYSWVDRGVNLDRAVGMIEQAVKLSPNDGYIVDSLGWAQFRKGDVAAATRTLERAVRLKPADATVNDHLGDAYWRSDRKSEARSQWLRALKATERHEQPDDDKLAETIRVKLDRGLVDRQAADGTK